MRCWRRTLDRQLELGPYRLQRHVVTVTLALQHLDRMLQRADLLALRAQTVDEYQDVGIGGADARLVLDRRARCSLWM